MDLGALKGLENAYFSEVRLPVRGRHWNSTPETVRDLAERLLAYGNRDIRIADLGSGHGYVQNALRGMGWRNVYGVEIDDHPIEHSQLMAQQMGLPPPQTIKADYHDPGLFSMPFPDGKTLQDMEFFFHYSYNPAFAQDMLINVLAGPGRARIGSLAWVTELRTGRINWAGFEPVKNRLFEEPCIRKIAAPKVSLVIQELPSRYEGMTKLKFIYV